MELQSPPDSAELGFSVHLPSNSPNDALHKSSDIYPSMRQNEGHDAVPISRKRGMRNSRTSHSYPRKRAVTACQTCRARKTKCTNERPTCSACAVTGATCCYNENADLSSFDPASLLILEKLHEVLAKLDNPQVGPAINHDNIPSRSSQPVPASAPGQTTRPAKSSQVDDSDADCTPSPSNGNGNGNGGSAVDDVLPPAGRTSADAILQWPVFGLQTQGLGFLDDMFIANAPESPLLSFPSMEDAAYHSHQSQVNLECAPRIVNDFLRYAHLKNPILETRAIRSSAKRVAEDGPAWDADTCLVLLACALGTIAKPFDPEPYSLEDSAEQTSLSRDWNAKRVADDYFYLARKRFGLLGCDLKACQCYLLSGIYLMYSMRPLQAWNNFAQASTLFYLYQKCQSVLHASTTSPLYEEPSPSRRLEQRIYWTCFKSECELHAEIPLPKSGIWQVDYPYMFPSPPTPGTPIDGNDARPGTRHMASPSDTGAFGPSTPLGEHGANLEEQSWFYYLAEIALRRIGNHIIQAFYSSGHESWADFHVPEFITMAERFERELEAWQQALPEPIRFSCPDSGNPKPMDELRFMNRGRYFDLQFIMYRPFLYYAIHNTSTTAHGHLNRLLVEPFAQKALRACLRRNDGVAILHRHHGTWYTIRSAITTTLLIIAAKSSGQILLEPLDEYKRAVGLAMRELAFWCDESPDFKRPRDVLEDMLRQVELY